jgi:hypothetical protein
MLPSLSPSDSLHVFVGNVAGTGAASFDESQLHPTGPDSLGAASTLLNVIFVVDCTTAGRSAFPGHERMWLGLGSQLHEDGHNVTVSDPASVQPSPSSLPSFLPSLQKQNEKAYV